MPHPLIVKELLGWISDSSATVVGVDLAAANRSNRFYGEFRVKDDGGGGAHWSNGGMRKRLSCIGM